VGIGARTTKAGLDKALQQHLERLLGTDESDGKGTRLTDDAQRLWRRVERFLSMHLIAPDIDRNPLELACYALQLPMRQTRGAPATGKLGQTILKDRAEQAAELLITAATDFADEALLDRTTRTLRELPQRSPRLPEAKLLADAVNLDDFGIVGLMLAAMQLARQSAGLSQVAEGYAKRQQYGYWAARLKDGFHFEPVRQIARERLKHAEETARLLLTELEEDQAP
jgi:hypothetical protein